MKKGLNILIFIFLITIMTSTKVFAATTSDIKIDGKFDDWKGKASYIDPKRDIISPWLNFLEVRYTADDKYLYLYVERESAKKTDPWDFKVIILNAEKEKKYSEDIPVEYELSEAHNYYRPIKFKKMDYAQFAVKSDYTYNKNQNGTPIKVSFEGQNLETTFSALNNNKIIEFRIPLEKVGLNGVNKEVRFMLKSAYDENAINKYGNKVSEYPYDWVPNAEGILVTTGPTLWQVSSILFFGFVSLGVYRIYKEKKNGV